MGFLVRSVHRGGARPGTGRLRPTGGREPVRFIGVNSRDSVPSALAFQQAHGISYPSLQDDGGRTRAQLGGLAVATPSTIVLDGQGRVAARISGQVDASTLRGLVDDVLESESVR